MFVLSGGEVCNIDLSALAVQHRRAKADLTIAVVPAGQCAVGRNGTLAIDNEGQVTINLNNADVPLKYFPVEIIRSTVLGMVSTLKGAEGEINRLEITIQR